MSVRRRITVCLIVLCLSGVALGWWLVTRQPPNEKPQSIPLFPIAKSRFLNTSPSATYVGTATCIECHADEHKSYLHTAHSRAFSIPDPKREPEDATYYHKPSGRHYQVYRKDGDLYHRESIKVDGKDVVASEYPIRYRLGSGRHARAYLAEQDGFLLASPITWYASRQKWDMAPGYDAPTHWGFERNVGTTCLSCHAGRVEHKPDVRYRVRIIEKAISCERCHGPGSLHVKRHRSDDTWKGLADLTIVRPSRLPRTRLESICGQCHLQAQATVPARGRLPEDFRPGLLLSDFRIDLALKDSSDQMTVVGHIEQLRSSVCYQKAQKLSCLTCHDLHADNPIEDRVAYYRNKCITCHAPTKCGVPVAKRMLKSPRDDCASCHMPRGDTDIPHVAFTHHRIGIHRESDPKPKQPSTASMMAALEDISRLPSADKDRCLGFGYLQLTAETNIPDLKNSYFQRAIESLERAYEAGLRDRETLTGLAEVYRVSDPERSIEMAKSASETKMGSADALIRALVVLTSNSPTPNESLEYLLRLKELRRRSDDWLYLGICHEHLQNPRAAMKALRKAEAIDPLSHELYKMQARIHAQMGQYAEAAKKRELAKQIKRPK